MGDVVALPILLPTAVTSIWSCGECICALMGVVGVVLPDRTICALIDVGLGNGLLLLLLLLVLFI